MAVLSFQMPNKIVMEKSDEFQGLFEFKALEPGYGVTVGNALRRVMLSSLEGYAITAIRVAGTLHEFSSIDGVVEDMSDIILNLKMIRFKAILSEEGEEPSETKFSARVSGQRVMTAGDLGASMTDFEILNPEHVICNLDEGTDFEIDFYLEKGRGYLPAEENTLTSQNESVDFIPIDAIFTPIKNVRYSIENTRVEQKTDYEKLIMDIETDGSIHPEDALKKSAELLIRHFMLVSDKNIMIDTGDDDEEDAVDEEMLHMRKLLKTPLSELDLSVRAYNCLKAASVRTLGDLAALEISDMMKFRNFGKKSLTELEQLMNDNQLVFGMDTVKYNLDED